MNLRVEAMVAEGDSVAVRFTERGTFSSPFRGIPPTDKSYEVIAMDWFVLRDGKDHPTLGCARLNSYLSSSGYPIDLSLGGKIKMFKFEDPELLETWFHESACHAGRNSEGSLIYTQT